MSSSFVPSRGLSRSDEPFAGDAGLVHHHRDVVHGLNQVTIPPVLRPRPKEQLLVGAYVDDDRIRLFVLLTVCGACGVLHI